MTVKRHQTENHDDQEDEPIEDTEHQGIDRNNQSPVPSDKSDEESIILELSSDDENSDQPIATSEIIP